MRGRLNLFQTSMLRWRTLHPYNAVHVVAVAQPLDVERLRSAIAATLEQWGLTGLVLDARRNRYEYRGGSAQFELATLTPDPELDVARVREIERQLNRAFPPQGPLEPFRFFTIGGAESFDLGIAYDHFVAAGDSIMALMKAICDHYSREAAQQTTPVERYPARCSKVLVGNLRSVLAGIRELPAMVASCRRSVRPPHDGVLDGTNGFSYFRLSPGETQTLMRTAKQWNVTLNDLLLALALVAVAPLAGRRDPANRRHEIGVASIVNIRNDFGPGAAAAFGQFLSSFRISHAMPDGIGLQTLAREVSAQTALIKREKLYLHSLLAMAASRLIWPFMNDAQRGSMHTKSYPTWVGVSSFDVNRIWSASGGGAVPGYIRAVPTGPLMPVVLAVTSAQDVLHFGVSYRAAVISHDDVARISGLLVQNVRRLAA
jgi:hypothetical protein